MLSVVSPCYIDPLLLLTVFTLLIVHALKSALSNIFAVISSFSGVEVVCEIFS